MKIVVYCQHVLGIGHFFRTLEICRALSRNDVILVTGGPEVTVTVPAHVRRVRLPGLQMNREFKGLRPTAPGKSVEAVKADRRKALWALFEAEAPDIFLLELYPFGRKAFRFEIDPVLKGIRCGNLSPAKVVCSVRDILVEREDALKYETRVIHTLNGDFNAILVHADPGLVKLDETFSRMMDIKIPVVYTGFVTPVPPVGSREKIRRQLGIHTGERLVVASAGGGKVGNRLLETVVHAWPLMQAKDTVRLDVFTGPYLDRQSFERLKTFAGPRVRILRFSENFLGHLAAADLSVSMAGYNTCMNVLAAGVPALVRPFPQNREQRLRAQRLQGLGALRILEDPDLYPERLAGLMDHMLAKGAVPKIRLNLDGAAFTAKWLEGRLKNQTTGSGRM